MIGAIYYYIFRIYIYNLTNNFEFLISNKNLFLQRIFNHLAIKLIITKTYKLILKRINHEIGFFIQFEIFIGHVNFISFIQECNIIFILKRLSKLWFLIIVCKLVK